MRFKTMSAIVFAASCLWLGFVQAQVQAQKPSLLALAQVIEMLMPNARVLGSLATPISDSKKFCAIQVFSIDSEHINLQLQTFGAFTNNRIDEPGSNASFVFATGQFSKEHLVITYDQQSVRLETESTLAVIQLDAEGFAEVFSITEKRPFGLFNNTVSCNIQIIPVL